MFIKIRLATTNRSEASPFKFLPDTYIGTVYDNDYVRSDACKDCHEDQFKAFSHTSHANLANISSWTIHFDAEKGTEAQRYQGRTEHRHLL